jgi:GxxExxY protein
VDEKTLTELTKRIIDCAVEVHRCLGPGQVDSIYADALCVELDLDGLSYKRKPPISVVYKEHVLHGEYLDIVVEDTVFVELRSTERSVRSLEERVLGNLRSTGKPVGMLINFDTQMLKDGIWKVHL